MYSFLRKFFRIYEGEGLKVFQFALLTALVQLGMAIGLTATDSLFLSHVGADRLPIIYLVVPVVMLVYIPLFSFLTDRYGIDRVFNLTLGLLMAGGVLFWAGIHSVLSGLISGPAAPAVFYAAKLYTVLWYIALYTLSWNFIDSYFDILDAKRLFPLFSGGIAFGSLAGGGAVTVMMRFMRAEQLYLAWAVVALATFPVLLALRRRHTKISEADAEPGGAPATIREQIAMIGGVLRTSSYTKLLILVSLATFIITTLCEYQYMTVFEQGRSAEEVAALFGRLYATVSVFNIVVCVFFFNRLVALLGVRNVALIQPVVYLVTFSYFLLDYGFGAAVVGFVAYQGLLTSVEYNNQNFLFNALPPREKATIRTFIEGLCEPLATALAGLFLMLAASRLSPQSLSLAGLVGAVAGLGLVLALRPQYLVAMIRNLRESWLDFSRKGTDLLTGLGPADIRMLEGAAQSDSPDQVNAAIRILWLNDRMAATQALLAHIERCSPDAQRQLKPLVATMLEEDDSQVYRRVLIWLERAKSRLAPALLEEFGRHNLLSREDVAFQLGTGSADGRVAAAAALWDTWRLDGNLNGLGIASNLLEGREADRLSAIRLIGESRRPRYAHFLARYLKDPAPAIRRQALAAMKGLVDESSGRLLRPILNAMEDGDREMRATGLAALARINDVECVEPLVRMSEYFAPSERRLTEAIILNIGLQSVPVLIGLVRDPLCPPSGRSTAVRALGKLSLPQLQSLAPELVDSEIRRAYGFLCSRWVLSRETAGSVALPFLGGLYRDAGTTVIEFILELLAISGRLPEFDMITASLRSRNVKERGNAIETIEQGCSRDVFRVLLPLVDSRSPADRIDFYTRTFGAPLPGFRDVLMGAVGSPVQLECAAGIQTVWDLTHSGEASRSGLECESICGIMQRKLVEPAMSEVKEVVFSLLARKLRPDDINARKLNVLEKACWIAMSDFFESFAAPELGAIAREARVVSRAAGERIYAAGQAADTAYIVVDGEIRMGEGADAAVVAPRGAFGIESLVGQPLYRRGAVSGGAELLAIPRDAILETARARESFASSLLAKKLGVDVYRRTA